MLSQLKNFVKKNESDIVLVIGVVLVALISFGAGRLTAFRDNKEPLIIQDSTLTASVQESLAPQAGGSSQLKEPIKEGKFVGSLKSDKYHWPWSSSAKRIKPENQIWFNSEAEAKAAGYEPAGDFLKWAPADFKP